MINVGTSEIEHRQSWELSDNFTQHFILKSMLETICPLRLQNSQDRSMSQLIVEGFFCLE